MMASRHETMGEVKGERVAKKKRTQNERGNSSSGEEENRAERESAGNTNGSLMWGE
jgi:hypothetical protein